MYPVQCEPVNGWKQYVTWVIAVVFSGLGGSALTYVLVNRSTIIEYTINRTALGTNETAVIPDFKVGDTSLKSLYIYSIKFDYRSGPELENAQVGIDFANPNARNIGKIVPESLSQVFPITCGQFKSTGKSVGTICSFGRFNSNVGTYTVSFATDTFTEINLSLDAKNAQLKIEGVRDAGISYWALVSGSVFSCVFAVFAIFISYEIKTTLREATSSISSTQAEAERILTQAEAELILTKAGVGRILTPQLSIDYEGSPANKTEAHYKKNDVDVDEIYIRVRVRNLGKETAKGARVFLTDLHEVHNAGVVSQKSLVWDSLQLAWAGSWHFESLDVPQGVSFYADVMRVSKKTSGWLLSVQKMRLANDADLVHFSGTLRFRVTVTADNAAPASCDVDVTYNQDWHSLRALQVPESVSSATSLS